MREVLKVLRRRWYLSLVILVILGVVFYRQQVASSQHKGTPYKVKKQTLQDKVSFSGQVDAQEKVNLQFQSGGRLAWVGVKEGDYVKKYQAVASLDERQLKDTLSKYLNTYAKTRLSFDQQKDDTREVVIGGLTYDQRQRVLRVADQFQDDLNNSVLDVQIQAIALEYANLYTPIEGIVDHVDTPVSGVNISTASLPTFRIVNPATIYFTANADQTSVVKLKVRQEAKINFDAYPDENVSAVIQSIAFSPTSGETGTVYAVKMNFLNNEGYQNYKYRLGMTGDASFVLREVVGVISVPSSYIKSDKGKKYVLKNARGKTEKVYVQTGETIDNQTVITSGLEDGDTIYD